MTEREREREPATEDSLERMLDAVEEAAGGEVVTVEDVLRALGPRAFGPLLLAPSLVMVSPASIAPGLASVLAAAVGLVAVQMLLGRRSVWLPRILLARGMKAKRLRRGVQALRGPVRRIDPLVGERLVPLAERPGNAPALVFCAGIAPFMPLVELIPFATSLSASAMALFALGVFARDGLLMLVGYALLGGGALLIGRIAEAAV